MSDLNSTSELEAELIKRNREIAKVRDEVLKVERRLEDSQMRNDDLLEKLAEIDSEVTKKSSVIRDLEDKVVSLETKIKAKEDEAQEKEEAHKKDLEKLREDFVASQSSMQQDKEGHAVLEAKIQDLEQEVKQLQQKTQEEEHKHCDTKARLLQAETSSRDLANRSVEQRRTIQELQDELQQRATFMPAEEAQKLEEDRESLRCELDRAKSMLEEHKSVRDDLEQQSMQEGHALRSIRDSLSEARLELEARAEEYSKCETAHSQVLCEYQEHKRTHEDVLLAERRRAEDHLQRVTKQAASLDGRLSGQRMLLEEASEALMRSEDAEAKVAAELTARVDDLNSERMALLEALERERAQAARNADEHQSQRTSELEAMQLCLQRQAASEVDAARRSEADFEERHRRLEARHAALVEDQSEERERQLRQQETLRAQGSDLRQRLAEAEERMAATQQERDALKRDIEEASQQSERTAVAHRLELERLQQAVEAEMQSRSSAEKVSQSKLEEKDVLLQHRDSTIDRLEADLAGARGKVEEMETVIAKCKADTESSRHALNLQNAKLDGELRSRQERLTEVEGRLEAQRQYLEQLSETLSRTQTDRDTLMETKGSLEAQLQLEVTQKDAVSASLQQMYEEVAGRCKELEVSLSYERDTHRHSMEDLQRSVGEDLRKGAERQAALEQELLTARQQCEHLMRNKADLQEAAGQTQERFATLEAQLQERRAEQERAAVEVDQLRGSKAALEADIARLMEEQRSRDAKVTELTSQLRIGEETRNAQFDDFRARVQKLDDLLKREQDLREDAERALSKERLVAEEQVRQREVQQKQAEQQLQVQLDSWRDQAEEAQAQLTQLREQAEAHRARAEDLDVQRRDMESRLRGEVATAEARLRRMEVEAQRALSTVEEGRAALAQQAASSAAKIAALQQQVGAEGSDAKTARRAQEIAEETLARQEGERQQMAERLVMAAEELGTRQTDYALDKQRLSGALEESRRTLRNSLGVPSPAATVDSIRLSALEVQLADERRRSIEQAVALQRAERRCAQLEDGQKRGEEQRADAVQRAREAERQRTVLSEELRRAQAQGTNTASQASEARERAAMSAAEIGTVRFESKYEVARLRGALDELRYMLRRQDGSGGPRPSLSTMWKPPASPTA